jgi:hypothetical protein
MPAKRLQWGLSARRPGGGGWGPDLLAGRIIDILSQFRGSPLENLGRPVLKKLDRAMSDGMFGSPSDWIAIWRAAIAERGWTHRDVDSAAQEDALARGERWGDGYCGKLLCSAREPTASTIARMNRVLGVTVKFVREVVLMP